MPMDKIPSPVPPTNNSYRESQQPDGGLVDVKARVSGSGNEKYQFRVGPRVVNTKVLRWLSGMSGLLPLPKMLASPPTVSIASAPTVNALTAGQVSHAWDSGNIVWGLDGLIEYAAGVGVPGAITLGDNSKASQSVVRARFMTDAPAIELGTAYSQYVDLNLLVNGEVGYVDTPVVLPTTAGNRYVKFDFGADTQAFELAQALTPSAGGAGYAIGDEITLAGGVGTKAVVTVTGVGGGGAVSNCYVKSRGAYSTRPTGAISQESTTGSGTGFQITSVQWASTHTTRKMRKLELYLKGGVRLRGINVDSNSLLLPWEVPKHFPRLVVCGDSQSAGTYLKSAFGNMATRIAHRLGLGDSYAINAQGGTGWNTNNGNNLKWSDPRRLADLIALNGDIYLFVGSQNDTQNSALQSAIEGSLETILSEKPDALIIGIGNVLSTGSAFTKAAFEAVASRSDRVAYIDNVTLPWITGTGSITSPTGTGNRDFYMSSDGQHLDGPGIDLFADIASERVFQALASLAV